MSAAKDKFDSLPGAEQFEALFFSALGGLIDLGSRAGMASIRKGAILDAYQERGHDVEEVIDIRTLHLRDIDEVRPKLALWYMAGATVEGAASGFAISGGEIVATGGTIAGAGAGAAPDIGNDRMPRSAALRPPPVGMAA